MQAGRLVTKKGGGEKKTSVTALCEVSLAVLNIRDDYALYLAFDDCWHVLKNHAPMSSLCAVRWFTNYMPFGGKNQLKDDYAVSSFMQLVQRCRYRARILVHDCCLHDSKPIHLSAASLDLLTQ